MLFPRKHLWSPLSFKIMNRNNTEYVELAFLRLSLRWPQFFFPFVFRLGYFNNGVRY